MKRLLILAGMPGSGKTYLLNKAMAENIRLFGDECQADFMNFMKSRMAENEPKNEDGMYRLKFTSFDYKQKSDKDDVFVYHMDLLGFYSSWVFSKQGKSMPVTKDDMARLVDRPERQKRVRQLFADSLNLDECHICVNILNRGFDANRAQFTERKTNRRRTKLKLFWPLYRHFYRPSPFLADDPGKARTIYKAIIRAWLEDMPCIGVDTLYHTKMVDGRYKVAKCPKP